MKDRIDSGSLEQKPSILRGWSRWTLGAGTAAVMAVSLLSLPPVNADAQQRASQAEPAQDYHQVVRGDTLWDLSGSYYGDHYQWPRMWGYNTHITNPHWIYPGDIVYLRDTGGAEEGVQQASYQEEQGRDRQRQSLSDDGVGVYLPLGGMMVTEEETAVGRIIGSPKEARMLAEHDEVWVDFGDRAYRQDERESLHEDDILEVEDIDVEVGDRFALIRQDGKLKDSDGETKAMKYYVLGSLEITQIPNREGVAKTAIIDQSWREIERGDLLVPYERQLQMIEPRQANEDLVAEIVDSLDPGFAFGPQQYVFVNRGAEDGVRPGNRFFAYQQWEGFEHPHEQSAPEIPWQRVGQVMVLDVRENYSTAVITRSDKELFIGDRLEMYQGH